MRSPGRVEAEDGAGAVEDRRDTAVIAGAHQLAQSQQGLLPLFPPHPEAERRVLTLPVALLVGHAPTLGRDVVTRPRCLAHSG